MIIHNINFHGEIRKNINMFGFKKKKKKKKLLSRAMTVFFSFFFFHLMDTVHFLSGDKSVIVASSQHMNPFMPCGLFYLNCLDWSISSRRDVWLVFILIIFYRNTCF